MTEMKTGTEMESEPLAEAGRALALQAYELLRETDPARWKAELADSVRPRLEALARSLRELVESHGAADSAGLDESADAPDRAAATPSEAAAGGPERRLREGLGRLAALLLESPGTSTDPAELKARWAEYRATLQAVYEDIAKDLRENDIHVPSLRPTNYWRNVFHVLSGIAVVSAVELLLGHTGMIVAAGLGLIGAWGMEISRRVSTRVNDFLMEVVFRRVSHPHEAHRINSATWYTTALFVLALVGSKLMAALAIVVLAFGDPAAALVGRALGRVRLLNGRTLEGSLAFLVAGSLAAFAAVMIWHRQVGLGPAAAIAGVAALSGAVAELVSRRVDDNLSIPIAAACGAWAVALAAL